ncbi:MAG: zinc ribbon domain-containing protein [Planctomycetota bacterium]
MPTYDYKCTGCGHEFELFQKMSDGAKRKCPECGKLSLKRLMGIGAGIIFKGSGFYETDYKRKSRNGRAGTERSTSTEKSQTKTEAKTEAKTAGSKEEGGAKAAAD